MGRQVRLKDGTVIEIRPMRADDLDRSFAFFQGLSAKERAYLRRDVTKKEVVADRIRAMETGRVKRLVAVSDGRIVADAALELQGQGWDEHLGEFRLVVARPYRRKGLGSLMARELYALAVDARLEEIVVKMMRPQIAARSIFRRLGFHEEVLLADYVKDRGGRKRDLVVMRCELEALWRELEEFIATWDWQRTR